VRGARRRDSDETAQRPIPAAIIRPPSPLRALRSSSRGLERGSAASAIPSPVGSGFPQRHAVAVSYSHRLPFSEDDAGAHLFPSSLLSLPLELISAIKSFANCRHRPTHKSKKKRSSESRRMLRACTVSAETNNFATRLLSGLMLITSRSCAWF
jgi:hypothetical protein